MTSISSLIILKIYSQAHYAYHLSNSQVFYPLRLWRHNFAFDQCLLNQNFAPIKILADCSSGDEVVATEPEAATTVAEPVEVEDEEDIVHQLPMPATLEGAIEAYTPTQMEYHNEFPTIMAVYALWNQNVGTSWNEINLVEKTSYGKVMKDAVSEYGKRLCVTGNIIEIETDRSLNDPVYSIGIVDNNFNAYRATAIESSGELVAGSDATFCGIVLARFSYDNAGGVTTRAPYLFGMFDLPENR